jgi:hypothetical protein
MKNTFYYFAYAIMFIVGGMMFVVIDGHIVKICIACTPVFKSILGMVAMITAIVGGVRQINVRSEIER